MKLSARQLKGIVERVQIAPSRWSVLVDVGGQKDLPLSEYNFNVYCIDDDDVVHWQVTSASPRMERDSFVALTVANGVLRADRFFGGEYLINVESGVAEETGWHK